MELNSSVCTGTWQAWWWTPGNEQSSVAGLLEVDAESRATVRINGRLSGASDEPGTHDVLWGYLDGTAQKVTLLRVLHMREHGVNQHLGASSLVKWVLLGHHLPFDAMSSVTEIRIHLDHAEQWYGRQLIPNPEWWSGDPIQTPKVDPVVRQFAVPGFGTFAMRIDCGTRPRDLASTEMWQHVLWSFSFEDAASLTTAEEYCLALRDLMSLFAGIPVTALNLEVRFKAGPNAHAGAWSTLLGSHVFSQSNDSVRGQSRHWREMFLPLIGEAFESIVGKWIRLRLSESQRVFSLWPLIVGGDRLGVDRTLFARTQFLDAMLPSVVVGDPDDFERAKRVVVGGIPADTPTAIAGAIQRCVNNANNGSFRERLGAALERVAPDLRLEYRLDEAVGSLVALRNALAHGDGFRKIPLENAVIACALSRVFAVSWILTELWPECPLVERFCACREWGIPDTLTRL